MNRNTRRRERLRERLLEKQEELETAIHAYDKVYPLFRYWLRRKRVGDAKLYKLFTFYRSKMRMLKSINKQLKELS